MPLTKTCGGVSGKPDALPLQMPIAKGIRTIGRWFGLGIPDTILPHSHLKTYFRVWTQRTSVNYLRWTNWGKRRLKKLRTFSSSWRSRSFVASWRLKRFLTKLLVCRRRRRRRCRRRRRHRHRVEKVAKFLVAINFSRLLPKLIDGRNFLGKKFSAEYLNHRLERNIRMFIASE